MNLYRRTRTLQDGTRAESPYYTVRLRWQGRQIVKNTGYTNLADAKRFGQALKKSLADERTADLAGASLRRSNDTVTLGKVLEAFASAAGSWTPQTRRGYVGGLRTLVETTLGTTPDWKSRPVDVLTSDLVFKFRHAVLTSCETTDDARRTQLSRSANTVLRSARALFSPSLLEHYRFTAELRLPDLSEFRSAPGFKGVAKEDYRIPNDDLIRRTLDEAEKSKDTHPDRYAALWLALGFGLRKSEAAAVRAGWFVRVGGRVHLEVRAVVEPGRPGQESTSTKNGSVSPRIPVANDAWRRLAPIVEALGAEDHVLAKGGTAHYRADDLFDEISGWLRGLGWKTDKAYHEFRALAGCWVAQTDGLLPARDWLRHSSVTTTERHYGRYVRTLVTDRPATVLDTTPQGGQQGPTVASLGTVGHVSEVATVIQGVDFQNVPRGTSSGGVEVRP